jgi:hypothetical protein
VQTLMQIGRQLAGKPAVRLHVGIIEPQLLGNALYSLGLRRITCGHDDVILEPESIWTGYKI